jgi:hypothetical protein
VFEPVTSEAAGEDENTMGVTRSSSASSSSSVLLLLLLLLLLLPLLMLLLSLFPLLELLLSPLLPLPPLLLLLLLPLPLLLLLLELSPTLSSLLTLTRAHFSGRRCRCDRVSASGPAPSNAAAPAARAPVSSATSEPLTDLAFCCCMSCCGGARRVRFDLVRVSNRRSSTEAS